MDSGDQVTDADNSKVTVKVLHPPGGASSNIFGTDSAEQQQQQQQQKSRPVKDRLPSSVFASGGDPPTASSSSEMGAQQEQQVKQDSSDRSSETPDKKRTSTTRKGFNPITGEAYEDSDTKANQKTANKGSAADGAPVRVGRQPPGGASSKLWWRDSSIHSARSFQRTSVNFTIWPFLVLIQMPLLVGYLLSSTILRGSSLILIIKLTVLGALLVSLLSRMNGSALKCLRMFGNYHSCEVQRIFLKVHKSSIKFKKK